MSVKKTVTQSTAFRSGRFFDYLEENDRYLAAPATPTLRYGVIGCGMMGREHMRNATLTGRAAIGGIYDESSRSVEHALKNLRRSSAYASEGAATPIVYNTLKEACADPTTDALIIATPNHTHLEVLRTASQHRKAIFLEKPIATTIEDSIEVCRLAKRHALTVRFGLQYRYKAIYAEAMNEVFERRSVGQVHSVNMLEHRFPFLDKVGQWNKFNNQTGGTLIEKCCHYFDLLNCFADSKPKTVFALGNQAVNFRDFNYNDKPADGLDQAQVSIGYENGVIGGFSLCMFAPGTREELTVCGDQGRLMAAEQALLGEENSNLVEVWRGENGASSTSSPAYPDYIQKAGHHGSTYYEHLAFADEVANSKTTHPNLEDGFWSVMVGAAAQASIERGCAVEVEELLPADFSL